MKRSLAAAILFILATILLLKLAGAQQRFDHEQHARLFPLCTSCHEGIESAEQANLYPSAATCAQCHDGKTEAKVDWSGPTRTSSNLKFDHPEHFEEAKDDNCSACHNISPAAKRMSVVRAEAETCIACHTKDQLAAGPIVHFAQTNDCTQCHVPLREARWLTTAQIARFSEPATHKTPGFLRQHAKTTAQDGSCATCHTTESCSRCHANAARVKVIAALGSNEAVAGVVAGKQAVYPTPFDHTQGGYAERHGTLAEAGIESCSNCHTREGCQQCHTGSSAADELARLPLRNAAPGVSLAGRARNAHPAGFAQAHGNTAGASGESCTSCHAQKFCSDCHQGADSKKFHAANFAARHAQEAYAGDTECASCHNRESFCQSCHNGLGMSANGQRSNAFHTGQSIWLLQHGQPARQNLESCTSCHSQASCARCHSAKGGWGVSPHGSGNKSSRLADKNQLACLRCHFSGTFRK